MKKNEARFTIKFNTANPRHKEAIRMLNEAGRSKASLIADALCMYSHYGAGSCDDLIQKSEVARYLSRVTREMLEISGTASLPKVSMQSVDTYDASSADSFDGDNFWISIGDSVESFFD